MTLPTTPDIRLATPADINALVALEEACFDYSRIGRRSFQRLVKAPSASIHLLEDHGQLAAYGLMLTRSNSRSWRLYSIATSPTVRGKGFGRLLLQALIEYARQHYAQRLTLEVKSTNKSAIALYEQLDFAVIDVLSGYYDDGTDAYKMALTLNE